MNILEEIVANKKIEVAERKALYPIKLLEKSCYFESPVVSLKKYLLREDKSGIIAEIKRKSPSKGMINKYVSIEKTSIGYMQAGASALSILTDQTFFGGKNDDLTIARKYNYCPILRKDFIIDEYQVIEARSIGADAILLIAAILSKERVKELACCAASLGLEVLMEVHDRIELDCLNPSVDIVGVNNRNLKNFETDMQHSIDLVSLIPDEFLKISESGISSPEIAAQLKQVGFDGFLIGEQFMKDSRPEEACSHFIKQLRKLTHEN